MPYQPHSEYRPPYAPPLQSSRSWGKKRPSAAWFVLGGVLMLVAAIVFGVAIFHFARTITRTDAVFPATGSHAVTLPPGTQRGLFVLEGRTIPRCQVRDGSGSPLHFRRPDERFTYGEWVAVRVFDSGDGNVVFTCPTELGGRIRIAPVPSDSDYTQLGLVGLLLPLGLGGLGFLVVLVTGVLWFSRRPRQPGPPYGAPPIPAYGAARGYPSGYPASYPPTYPSSGPPTYPPTEPPAEPPTDPPTAPPPGPVSGEATPPS